MTSDGDGLWASTSFRLAALLLSTSSVAAAQGGPGFPAGGEFQVNSYTTSSQRRADVVMNDQGNFVIVWHGAGDTDSYGVSAQRFDSSGNPQAGEFQVNSYSTDNQAAPRIAGDDSGRFVVAWMSRAPQDGELRHLRSSSRDPDLRRRLRDRGHRRLVVHDSLTSKRAPVS